MGIKGISTLLPFKRIPSGYFSGKSVCLDFFNFAFKTANFTAVSLIVDGEIHLILKSFRQLISKLLVQGAKVFLIMDGPMQTIKAPTSLPRMQRRRMIREKAFETLEKEGMREAHRLFARGFTIKQSQIQRLVCALVDTFRDRSFVAIFSPSEADHQIQYMAQRGMINCIISDDTDMAFCGIDCIRNYSCGSCHGDLITAQDAMKMQEKYGGKEMFSKLCLLNGNDYFPGFECGFDQIYEVLVQNGGDLMATAKKLNQQKFVMSFDRICKAFYQFYATEAFSVVFNPNSARFVYQNEIGPKDREIIDKYFEKDALGRTNDSGAQVLEIASGYCRDFVRVHPTAYTNYQKLRRLQFTPCLSLQSSIVNLLGMKPLKDGLFEFSEGMVADFKKITFQARYLERQTPEDQQLFNYKRAAICIDDGNQ